MTTPILAIDGIAEVQAAWWVVINTALSALEAAGNQDAEMAGSAFGIAARGA